MVERPHARAARGNLHRDWQAVTHSGWQAQAQAPQIAAEIGCRAGTLAVDIPRALCTNCTQAKKLDSSPAGPMPGTGETG
jgi:hypothetical protein